MLNDTLFGALGAVIAGVLGWLVLRFKGGFPKRAAEPPRSETEAVQRAGALAEAERKTAAQASEAREAADDAAIQEVGSRPHTDDAVADLEARLRSGVRIPWTVVPGGPGSGQPPKEGHGPDRQP